MNSLYTLAVQIPDFAPIEYEAPVAVFSAATDTLRFGAADASAVIAAVTRARICAGLGAALVDGSDVVACGAGDALTVDDEDDEGPAPLALGCDLAVADPHPASASRLIAASAAPEGARRARCPRRDRRSTSTACRSRHVRHQ
jgi:hypothetical protein